MCDKFRSLKNKIYFIIYLTDKFEVKTEHNFIIVAYTTVFIFSYPVLAVNLFIN